MTVCRNKGINCIYIPIWVAEATHQLCGKLLSFILFFSGSYRNIYRQWTGLFLVLRSSDWTEWHVRTEGLKAEINSLNLQNSNVTRNTTSLAYIYIAISIHHIFQ